MNQVPAQVIIPVHEGTFLADGADLPLVACGQRLVGIKKLVTTRPQVNVVVGGVDATIDSGGDRGLAQVSVFVRSMQVDDAFKFWNHSLGTLSADRFSIARSDQAHNAMLICATGGNLANKEQWFLKKEQLWRHLNLLNHAGTIVQAEMEGGHLPVPQWLLGLQELLAQLYQKTEDEVRVIEALP